MKKGDNSLLLALALLERTKAQMKIDKREQISRAGLQIIQQSLSQALEQINKSELSDIYILGYLISVTELVDNLLKNESYFETDTETKEIITSKVLECLESMYISVGKYYETHDFDYTIKLSSLLERVVNKCVDHGYYFGIDAELEEETV